jgi:HAD superfamily hydrolase (TIGR01549 family)
VRVVITDLDDTLYDWLTMWHAQFTAALDVVLRESKLNKDIITREWKRVHESHHTSEYAFPVEELPSLRNKYRSNRLRAIANDTFKAMQKARLESLRLFPKVLPTLQFLKERGCMIVAFTEAKSYYAGQRVRMLGLDGIIDYLYSSEHDEMSAVARRRLNQPPYNFYELKKTIVRHTAKGLAKPNSKILQGILNDIGADPKETVYIGDKKDRDVTMAQAAGTIDVHASYGEAKDRPEYELLREVTHWTQEDVERERNTGTIEASPSYVIKSFGDLCSLFRFERFVEPRKHLVPDDEKAVVEAWKKTIDVQQHFNDLELRIRNFGLTIIVAILGAIGLGISRTEFFSAAFYWYGSLLTFGGIGVWLAFYFMDAHWYHRLLQGAVKHGDYIEQRCRIVLPELRLTQTISEKSPSQHWGRIFHSYNKLDFFYAMVTIGLLIVFGFFLFSALNLPPWISRILATEFVLGIIIVAGLWFMKRELI